MVAIHFIYYDFCWKHRTIKTAPAVAVGVNDHIWNLSAVVRLNDG